MGAGGVEVGISEGGTWSGGDGDAVEGCGLTCNANPTFF